METIHERTLAHINKAMGSDQGGAAFGKALTKAAKQRIETPQDLLQVAKVLMEFGGITAIVGQTLKVQALLRGAK